MTNGWREWWQLTAMATNINLDYFLFIALTLFISEMITVLINLICY